MKQLIWLLAITTILLAAIPTGSVAETITACFEGGSGSVDTWQGNPGDGWLGPWATKNVAKSGTVTCTLTNTSPLATGANNYVSTVLDAAAANDYVTIGRRYDRSNGVEPDKIDQTQDYTISYLFRIDENLGTGTTFYTNTTDRYQLYQSTPGTSLAGGGGASSTWIIGAYGGTATAGDGHTIPAGNWQFSDYATGTEYKWDTGINATTVGAGTYAVQITIHPNYTWDATMSAGTSSYTKTGMGFRVKGLTGGYVEFFGKATGSDDFRGFSIDSVVVAQVPEPSMLIMALGAALAGLTIGRRPK